MASRTERTVSPTFGTIPSSEGISHPDPPSRSILIQATLLTSTSITPLLPMIRFEHVPPWSLPVWSSA